MLSWVPQSQSVSQRLKTLLYLQHRSRNQEQSTARRDAILKMLAGLLDSVDVGREAASPDIEEEGKLEEERAVLGRLTQLSQRDRKAPCKNFFWKTFTSC
ncbi:cortistatin isoform X2 [Falco peregrinus]|uniref:cortistatin isoform X2 n=1 Tax=Falco peregrinus TaxID=8954 RepID=UPI000FFBF136|nr:cortistatin isoform X2 [Falco peregrinus]